VLLQTNGGTHTFTFNSTGLLGLPDVAPNDNNAVRKDYVDQIATYTEGNGIDIVDNEISVELYAGDSYLIHDATTGAVRLNTLGVVTTDQAQTISGAKTFSASLAADAGISTTGIIATLNSGTTAAAPTADSHWTRKDYVDGIAIYSGGNSIDITSQTISVDIHPDAYLAHDGGQLNINALKTMTIDSAQSVSGTKTFTAVPKSTVDPSADNDLVRKSYADANYGSSTYTGGDGIDVTGTTISVDLDANAYLAFNGVNNELTINALKTATIDTQQSFSGQKTFNATNTFAKNIIPTADSLYDLGSTTVRWAEIHADTIYEGGTALSAKYAPVYTGGNSIDITGSTISVDIHPDAYLAHDGGQLNINALKTMTIDTAQSVSGTKTFTSVPKSTVDPSVDNDLVRKSYADANYGSVTYTGGNSIDITGTTISVDINADAYLAHDNGTLNINALKTATIDTAQSFSGQKTFNAATTYAKDFIPVGDSLYDLGSSTVRWAQIHGDTIYEGASTLASKYVALTGNQTVAGIKTFSSVVRSSATPSGDTDLITKAYADANYSGGSYTAGNGIDITGSTISVDLGDSYLVFDGTTGALKVNTLGIATTATAQTISGAKTFTATLESQGQTWTSGLYPRADITYNLGSATFRWGTAYLYNIVSDNYCTFKGTTDCQGTTLLRNTYPPTTNTYYLGTDTNRFSVVHATNFWEGGTALAFKYVSLSANQSIGGNKSFTGFPSTTYVTGNGTAATLARKDYVDFLSSDVAWKENISPTDAEFAISALYSLQSVNFDWKEGAPKSGNSFGFIAQEVEDLLPDIVSEYADGKKGYDMSALVGLLWAQNRAQQERIEALEKAVESLLVARGED